MQTDDQAGLLDMLPATLSKYLLAQAPQSSKQSERNNFIAARWLLYRHFHSLGVSFDFGDIHYTASGKPFLNNQYQFSISHTDGLCGVLIGCQPLGLDMEWMREIENMVDFNYVFTHEEMNLIEQEGLTTFFRMWTTKEAILKLTGNGITDPAIVQSIKLINKNAAAFNGGLYHIQPFLFKKKYYITIALADMPDADSRIACYLVSSTGNDLHFTAAILDGI